MASTLANAGAAIAIVASDLEKNTAGPATPTRVVNQRCLLWFNNHQNLPVGLPPLFALAREATFTDLNNPCRASMPGQVAGR